MVQLFFGGSFEFLLEGLEWVGNGKKKGKERKKAGIPEERGGGRREKGQPKPEWSEAASTWPWELRGLRASRPQRPRSREGGL